MNFENWTIHSIRSIRQHGLAAAWARLAKNGLPSFDQFDPDAVNLERLLLPFGKDGRVQVILASLQLISLQGTVNRRSVVGHFEVQCETVLSITIPAASFSVRPKRLDEGDELVSSNMSR